MILVDWTTLRWTLGTSMILISYHQNTQPSHHSINSTIILLITPRYIPWYPQFYPTHVLKWCVKRKTYIYIFSWRFHRSLLWTTWLDIPSHYHPAPIIGLVYGKFYRNTLYFPVKHMFSGSDFPINQWMFHCSYPHYKILWYPPLPSRPELQRCASCFARAAQQQVLWWTQGIGQKRGLRPTTVRDWHCLTVWPEIYQQINMAIWPTNLVRHDENSPARIITKYSAIQNKNIEHRTF